LETHFFDPCQDVLDLLLSSVTLKNQDHGCYKQLKGDGENE